MIMIHSTFLIVQKWNFPIVRRICYIFYFDKKKTILAIFCNENENQANLYTNITSYIQTAIDRTTTMVASVYLFISIVLFKFSATPR